MVLQFWQGLVQMISVPMVKGGVIQMPEIAMNIGRSHQKWQDLLLYLKNSTPTTFQLVFPDVQSAKDAARRILVQVDKYSSWFPMVVARRGCNVYVVKTYCAQKVMIKDEVENH
jgi:hypothetical protein